MFLKPYFPKKKSTILEFEDRFFCLISSIAEAFTSASFVEIMTIRLVSQKVG